MGQANHNTAFSPILKSAVSVALVLLVSALCNPAANAGSTCKADFNNDGQVNIGDHVLLSNNWRCKGSQCARSANGEVLGDTDDDGDVDFSDFSTLSSEFGTTHCETVSATRVGASEPVKGVAFAATVVRAYPESKWEFSSPFEASIAPAQRRLHVALEPSQPVAGMDDFFNDDGAPKLVMTRDGASYEIATGYWLMRSAGFELDAAIRELKPGLYELAVVVRDKVVATVPDVLLVAAGDINRDGFFDSADMTHMESAGKYETGQPASADDGDADGDELFTSTDIVVMAANDPDVVYNGAAYTKKASTRAEEAGVWVVGDYECWLTATGPVQGSFYQMPPVPNEQLDNYTFSALSVERDCSAMEYDPHDPNTTSVDMRFKDPVNPSRLHARCNFDGVEPMDANLSLAEFGEKYTPGSATIKGTYSHNRHVKMYCEPVYFESFDDAWVQDEDGEYTPRMTANETCDFELDVSAKGTAWAYADGGVHLNYDELMVNLDYQITKAESETKLTLQYPKVSEIKKESKDSDPTTLLLSGTAQAISPKDSACPSPITDVKCRVGLQLSGRKLECFAEVSGKAALENIQGCLADNRPTQSVMHLARGKENAKKQLSYDGPIHTNKRLSYIPLEDGPYSLAVGTIAVYNEGRATSNAVTFDGHIVVSEASSAAEGTVRIRLNLPPPPTNMTEAQQENYDDWLDNHSHCHILQSPLSRDSVESTKVVDHINDPTESLDAYGNEESSQHQIIYQRGQSVSVSTESYRYPFFIERNTDKAYPVRH